MVGIEMLLLALPEHFKHLNYPSQCFPHPIKLLLHILYKCIYSIFRTHNDANVIHLSDCLLCVPISHLVTWMVQFYWRTSLTLYSYFYPVPCRRYVAVYKSIFYPTLFATVKSCAPPTTVFN